MESYYCDKLSAHRLKQCYELAPLPVQNYLAAEIDHVRKNIRRGSSVLELGCGPGRFSVVLAQKGFRITGVDRTGFLLEKAKDRPISEGVEIEWIQEDMRDLTEKAGFMNIKLYGNLEGDEYGSDTTRLVVVGRRNIQ